MIPYVNEEKQREADDYDALQAKDVEWYHKVLLNRPSKVLAAGTILAIVAPVLIYHFLFFSSLDLPPSDGFSAGSCLLPRSSRLLCGIGMVNDTECHTQCCYDYELHVCFHRFPSRFSYILTEEWNENMTLTPRIETVPYRQQDSLQIQLAIDERSPTHIVITFYDPKQMIVEGQRISEKNYIWSVSTPELNIIVNDTRGNEIFNTVRGPVIASENIWEVAFRTTDDTMYGFGEIPLVEGTVKVLYSHDGGPSAIPLIFSRTNGSYNGLLIDLVEPTEVRFKGDNQVVIRSITKKGLKFHLFTGPSPEDIMKDVMKIIDFKNELEYWMLGAHVCSEISTSTNAYEDLVDFATTASDENMPYDSHCGVAPVESHDDCEENEHQRNLVKGFEVIKSHNKRFMPHISPYIFYKEANITEENNSTEAVEPRSLHNCSNLTPEFENFLLRSADSTDIYKGKVDNKTVIYPDYETIPVEFINKLWPGPKIDGVILENNWPLDESWKQHNETYVSLPYFNEHFERAFNITPQWNVTRANNETYIYSHNIYANHFTDAFRLTTKNSIPIFTTAQWMAGEIVNRQNIDASWTNLQKELTETALGGISGHWLWSSPICGDTKNFNSDTQTQLCVKWYMAATFLPLIKIHSKEIERHPLAFSGTNKANILRGLNHRYSFLPYFYTTLQEGPLLRPMFYQFPFSTNISNLKTQFSVGDDLLIVPNLQPSQSHVHVRMPPGLWFEFWSGLVIDAEEGETVTMTTTDADFLVLIRAGAIIVTQKDVKETAGETRLKSDYSLTVALSCDTERELSNPTCQAKGKLYLNKDMKLHFKANSEQLIIRAEGEDFQSFCDGKKATWASMLKEVNVYGLDTKHNNYDHHRYVVTWSRLCLLETQETIVINLI